jgi:Ca2+-transporting ATPase
MAKSEEQTDQSSAKQWYALPSSEVLAHFVSSAAGLSTQEADQRYAKHGPNELKETKGISPFRIFIAQFNSLIIWILLAAGIISALLGETIDAIAILAIVVLNAAVGFYQEFSAERSIAALKKMTAPQVTVRRNDKMIVIPASGIVTGDILLLEAGNIVGADARIVTAASFKVIEAALTGESESVEKNADVLAEHDVPLGDRRNMVFMGTSIATGTAQAIVVATAMDTELGRIAGLITDASTEEHTPLEKKLESFGRVLVWVTLGIVILLFGLGLLRKTDLLELFMSAVSLAVAAVPEGLPAVVTISLAVGVVRMSRRNALIRKLPAVETLGSTTVICTDKTGTLTVGEMTVRALAVDGITYEVTGNGYGPEGEIRKDGVVIDGRQTPALLELASILIGCNNAHRKEESGVWSVIGDPTEGAMLTAGLKAGGNQENMEKEHPKVHEFPFDSDRKLSSVIRKQADGSLRVYANGAPGILLQRCTKIFTGTGIRDLTDTDRTAIASLTSGMAKQALRVLSSAYRDMGSGSADGLSPVDVEKDLVFVGLTGMYDPPRAEAKESVARCREAGVRVVMITGDHPETAVAIAREIGIAAPEDVAVSGIELEKMSDEELKKRISAISVYARVTAEHKLRIIRAWKANDAVVAMTGDGVNDAPAIKGADIGIAMGKTGTEVTKQSSDMIITDDNFSTIVSAIEEGRGIYDNIRKTLQYLLAGNTGELLLMTVCVIIGLPIPLLPIHLLWINLVTDGFPALALATDPIDPDVMKRKPRRRSEKITDKKFLGMMFFTGVLTAGTAFAVYAYMLQVSDVATARTYAFTVLVFEELLRSFGARSESKPIWKVSFFSNMSLLTVVGISFGLQILSQHSKILGEFLHSVIIPYSDMAIMFAIAAIPLAVLQIVKVLMPLQTTQNEKQVQSS